MPDKNFEEDVRKKMEELRFVPSGDVWAKVEENIREDRKRRRFLFWLPLTGILIGGLLWFTWPRKNATAEAQMKSENHTTNAAETQAPLPPPSSTSATIPGQSSGSESLKTPVSPETTVNSAPSDPKNTVADSPGSIAGISPDRRLSDNDASENSGRTERSALPVITNEADYLASMSKATTGRQKNLPTGKKYRTEKKSKPVAASEPNQADLNGGVLNQTAATKNPVEENKTTAGPGENRTADAATIPAVTVATAKKAEVKDPAKIPAVSGALANDAKGKKTVKPDSKKSKIEWGLTAFGGVSKQTEKNVIPSDVLARALASNTVYVIKNSELKAGPAFSIGFVASKQFGKTWRWQLGISYAYYSSKLTNPGQYLSAPASNSSYTLTGVGVTAAAFGARKNTTYSNRYQFLQVPVTLEKRFSANSPLSAQAGIAFGYLSSIHALIYQPLLDQYWQDNAEFNKFQMTGLAGLYWKFKIDDSWSLRAGPELQYQLTNLMKSNAAVQDHLLTGAIRLTLMHSAK